jgi:hypothetical protein
MLRYLRSKINKSKKNKSSSDDVEIIRVIPEPDVCIVPPLNNVENIRKTNGIRITGVKNVRGNSENQLRKTTSDTNVQAIHALTNIVTSNCQS